MTKVHRTFRSSAETERQIEALLPEHNGNFSELVRTAIAHLAYDTEYQERKDRIEEILAKLDKSAALLSMAAAIETTEAEAEAD